MEDSHKEYSLMNASMQMAAYLIGENPEKLVQAKRINRFVGALPNGWFQPTPPRNAHALVEASKRLASRFGSKQKSSSKTAATLKEFSAVLTKLGLLEHAANVGRT